MKAEIIETFKKGMESEKIHNIFYRSSNNTPTQTTDRPQITNISTDNDDLSVNLIRNFVNNENNSLYESAQFKLKYTGSERTFISDINLNITGITGYDILPIDIECNGTLEREPMYIYNPNESPVTVDIKQTNNGAPLLMIKYKYSDSNKWIKFKNTEVTPVDNIVISFTISPEQYLYICSLEDNEITDIINNIDKTKTTLSTWCYEHSNLYFSCNNSVNNLIIGGDIMSLINENTMGSYCFRGLFENFTALKTVKNDFLTPKILSEHCYDSMFSGCTSLKEIQELPATTLAQECYREMFKGCTSLKTAPELLATSVAQACCFYMFHGCTSLVNAPSKLPATTLAESCYSYMFSDCKKLINAPELPATTLAPYCYESMFSGCTSLTTAPELPATELQRSCYMDMFYNCTSLVNAPSKLPATTLKQECYREMFRNCNKINNITMLATPTATTIKTYFDSGTDFKTYNWLENTAIDSPGTLHITSDMNELRNAYMAENNNYDPLHIPDNWNVKTIIIS